MKKLHLFELREGHVVLDGAIIRGIRECEFSIKENDSHAELSLKMDVRTLGDKSTSCFDCIPDDVGKIRNCHSNKLSTDFFPNSWLGSILNKLISGKG